MAYLNGQVATRHRADKEQQEVHVPGGHVAVYAQ